MAFSWPSVVLGHLKKKKKKEKMEKIAVWLIGLDTQRLGECKLFICKAARACPRHPYIDSLPTH